MPKNKKGGNKAKKGSNKRFAEADNHPFITKDIEGGQEYAKVIKSMGGCPPILSIICSDGKERIGVVSGKLRKKVFCNKEDIVLVNLRDYQDSKCDIIWKYTDRDVKRLVKEGEITSIFSGIKSSGEQDHGGDNFDDIFQFDYTEEDKEKQKKKEDSSSSEYETDSDEDLDIANI
jgi:translation initiation factor 1A